METVAWPESDSALLDELLSFLDEPPTSESHDATPQTHEPPPQPRTEKPPPKATTTGGEWSLKRKIAQVKLEAEQLTQQLTQLQHSVRNTRSPAMLTAQSERFRRRRAEAERETLRDAVYRQAQFIRGLKSVFSAPPQFASGLNLCQYLHNYTRLPRDRPTRWTEYAALAQETRLRAAMDILCRETESLEYGGEPVMPSVDSPFIRTEQLTDRGGFGMTTTSVFALETSDLGLVLRGACVAVSDIVAKCQTYECTSRKKEIVDADARLPSTASGSNVLYRVLGVHHKSRRDSDELCSESRLVTFYKQTQDFAVIVWDFIDDDELYPESEATDITRQAVGACLIRRELCDDGVERPVYRAISTRRYRFHDHAPQDALQRFQYRYLAADKMKTNELAFRRIMLESIAHEEEAYRQASGA